MRVEESDETPKDGTARDVSVLAYDEESYDCHPAWMGRCLKIRSIYRILNFKS